MTRSLVALLALAASACVGVVTAPGDQEAGANDADKPGGKDAADGPCLPSVPQRIVLLSDFQFTNTISALLGANVLGDDTPDAANKSFSSKGLAVSTSLVSTRLDWADKAASTIAARFSDVTGCASADRRCATAFLERFMARAFRRPSNATELADMISVYDAGAVDGVAAGVELAVQAILSAPSFTYRTEVGTVQGDGSVALTDHELASELSYLLMDSAPDEELRAAADAGKLNDPETLRSHVQRLLQQPAVQENLTQTVLSAWGVSNIFGTPKDPGLFPEYTPNLQASMYHETELFVADVLWAARPVSELLTSTRTFVNGTLAQLYGVPFAGSDATQFVPVTLPAGSRSGIFTQPSVLAARARTDTTSVVARGLFVRGMLLCLPKVPGPPEELAAEIQNQLAADLTERERAQVRADTSPCGGCHAQFDPFGLLLESYDAIGRQRSDVAGEPVNASVDLSNIADFTGSADGIHQLAEMTAAQSEFRACLTRHFMAYATASDELATSDCQVAEVTSGLSATPSAPEILQAVGISRALRLRSKEGS